MLFHGKVLILFINNTSMGFGLRLSIFTVMLLVERWPSLSLCLTAGGMLSNGGRNRSALSSPRVVLRHRQVNNNTTRCSGLREQIASVASGRIERQSAELKENNQVPPWCDTGVHTLNPSYRDPPPRVAAWWYGH